MVLVSGPRLRNGHGKVPGEFAPACGNSHGGRGRAITLGFRKCLIPNLPRGERPDADGILHSHAAGFASMYEVAGHRTAHLHVLLPNALTSNRTPVPRQPH